MAYRGARELGDFFSSRREKGISGMPTLAVTIDRGLVARDSIDRKMETNLPDEEHLLGKSGDIAYNMMRMWQGAFGLVESDGLLSPAYIVLAPKIGVDSKYATYLFKSSRLIYLFWAYSYGLTNDRLRLYFKDFKKIPVDLPSILEQQKIARILSTWDKAIEKLESLITAKKKRKKVLMQQLLTGKKRFAGFEGGWKEVRFGDLLKDKKCKGKIVPTNAESKGLPYIGSTSFEGSFGLYSDSDEAVTCISTDILILWDGENAGKVATNLTGVVSSTVVRYKLKTEKANNEFIAYCLLKDNYKIRAVREGSGIPHMPGDFENWYELFLPPIEEQQKIASVLYAADKEIETHQSQLSTLKQQKKGLMQQLLTGKKRVKIDEPEQMAAVEA